MHSAQKKKTTPSNSHQKAAPFFNQTGEGSFFSESTNHDTQAFQAKFFENRDPIQAKLTMGAVGDKHEIEADQVANKVLANEQTPTQSALGNTHPSFNNTIHMSMGQTQGNLALKASHSPLSINKKETSQSADLQLDKRDDSDFSDKQPSAQFENKLSASRGSGTPLPADTKHQMETGIGANFSNVKVHTGSNAVQMSSEIGARAFTHGNDVYFNANQYQPASQEGRHLIAHELTHTVQQGASVRTKPITSESSAPRVQRSILDRVGSFFSGIRNRVVNFIENIPGFFLFTVLLGRNPLTDIRVDRNGMNFIKGFLLLLPNGQEKYNRLQQDGALDRSATWIDQQISTINNIRNDVSDAFRRAVDSLSISDVARPGRALERIRGYFSPVISRAREFATSMARQVLQFLKDAVLNSLVNFVKDRTRAYPLLRVLLGRDPITNEEVPRTMENVIHAFLMLTEAGEDYYNKMVESGALTRATTWMREQIATLPSAGEVMDAFGEAWRSLSFADMLQPIAAFQRIYGILSNPIGRILSFVGAVAMQILVFIKDALLGWLKSNANDIPGYHLLTVILRKDPFTNEVVPRTITNLIRGFMGLVPGGEQQFQQMQESGVIPRLAGRINDAVDALGFTWDYIRNLFIGLWQSMQIADLMQPLQVLSRVIATFTDPLQRLFNFIRVVITAIIEVLLRMMNFPIDLVGQIIDNAMQAWEDIKRDPIGFLKNLMRAAKKGFEQFFDNFVQHLIGGVTGWLFSELETAGIRPPPDITFRSILGMAMDVLGITTDNIFARLAQKIGQERVDQIRSVMDRLTGIWEFVRDVMDRGAVAIWERIQTQLSNLWDVVVEGIRNWIVTRIVQGVTTRLLSMLDPTGIMAVVNGFITFFRAVQSFIEQLTRILQVINTFVQGVGQIARGNIQQAADYLENALARALPVAIAFLANQVGLRGLGSRIGEMVERARELINRGIDWLLDRAIALGTSVLNTIMGNSPNAENEPESGTDGPAREHNKQMAIRETRTVLAGGIQRISLRNFLADLRQRYNLRRAELNGSDDVIIENSDPVTIAARPITVNQTSGTPAAPTTAAPTNSPIRVGTFTGTKDPNVQTIWGILRGTGMNPPAWPQGADVTAADRPRTVEATLFGYPGDGLQPEARDNDATRNVGHWGNYESGLRRGNVSWRSRVYDGGHILGHQFGGGETYDNLVPQQNNQLNRGLYARMETFIRDSLPVSDVERLANPGETRMQIRATMNYSGMVARQKHDIAKVASNQLGAGGPDFHNAMDESKRAESATVPERTPSSLVVAVELSADLLPASLATVEGSSSGSRDARTRATSSVEVNDPNNPTLVPEDSTSTSANGGDSTQAPPTANVQPQRSNWTATFTFTQGNQA